MGWSAARKLRRGIDGLTRVLAVELLTAARGIELRAAATCARCRHRSSRPFAPPEGRPQRRSLARPRDRHRCRALITTGAIVAAAESVTGALN